MPGALHRSREANGFERRTSVGVADIPDSIVLRRHRDLEGRRKDVWFRRGPLALVAGVPLLRPLHLFGPPPRRSTPPAPAAPPHGLAPTAPRGGGPPHGPRS